MQNWLLPEFIEDILPPEAARIEGLRRQILELFTSWGYQQVTPPMVEYLHSLLTGAGHDLDLKTFKVVDQLTGQLMGIRADLSPQVARIDAHLLNALGVTRLCYAGTVLHTLPDGLMQAREFLQMGAELYGHSGIEADCEIQGLMLDSIRATGLTGLHLDLGHVGIFHALMNQTELEDEGQSCVFDAMRSKDPDALKAHANLLPPRVMDSLMALQTLYGGIDVIDQAKRLLPKNAIIERAFRDLEMLIQHAGDVSIGIDLADLHGYHYHSGVVFAVYAPGFSQPLARGGRYDRVGEIFGRARPATGFSMNLRALVRGLPPAREQSGILAPLISSDPVLCALVRELRAKGEVVIYDLPGHEETSDELACNRIIKRSGRGYKVVPI
ncbi:MAG TPA: ATP phosphoribosyltransferase regulatory subunit [Burkholderiales bacterium]|nr:ATP phosphoribosyltransferase regulatory subunit [Burkholderiales bacterium]